MAVRKKYNSSALGRGLDNISSGRGLGLDALIDTSDIETKGTSNLNEITINLIEPNPNQPRHEFDEQALKELAMSIREIGIITPITVRQTESGSYQIIAGERRWRAAQIAGLSTLEDLNAIEIALAYQRLAETTGLTQEKISERVGKSRTSITNYMRLLKLPAPIQMALKNKEMDMGHARALLSIDSPSAQIKLFNDVKRNGYSVRKVEELVQAMKKGDSLQEAKKAVAPRQLPLEYSILRDRLSQLFGVRVQMTCSPQSKGRISIPFENEDELGYPLVGRHPREQCPGG